MRLNSERNANRWSIARHFLMCLIVTAITAHAQYRAGIQGVVTDPNGAVVPGAAVTLISNETNFRFSTKTSEGGVYVFSALAPGAYLVTVEKQGFSKKILNQVRVDAEETRSLNVQLEVGQVTESVTVA